MNSGRWCDFPKLADVFSSHLGRVGVIPAAEFMSTAFAKQVAEAGSFYSFMSETAKAAAAEFLF